MRAGLENPVLEVRAETKLWSNIRGFRSTPRAFCRSELCFHLRSMNLSRCLKRERQFCGCVAHYRNFVLRKGPGPLIRITIEVSRGRVKMNEVSSQTETCEYLIPLYDRKTSRLRQLGKAKTENMISHLLTKILPAKEFEHAVINSRIMILNATPHPEEQC